MVKLTKLVSVSIKKESNSVIFMSLRMSKTMHKKADELAKKEGVSLNSLLNEAIISYVTCKNLLSDIDNEKKA